MIVQQKDIEISIYFILYFIDLSTPLISSTKSGPRPELECLLVNNIQVLPPLVSPASIFSLQDITAGK